MALSEPKIGGAAGRPSKVAWTHGDLDTNNAIRPKLHPGARELVKASRRYEQCKRHVWICMIERRGLHHVSKRQRCPVVRALRSGIQPIRGETAIVRGGRCEGKQ